MSDEIVPDMGKCLDGGTGRRLALRVQVRIPAGVTTTMTTNAAELLNISATGALLRGSELPRTGKEVLVRFERVEAFGTVAWSQDRVCGVRFDQPMSSDELRSLRLNGGSFSRLDITPDERLATEAWVTGFAR